MFTDVYEEIPAHLQVQRDELREHLKEYGKYYPVEQFQDWLNDGETIYFSNSYMHREAHEIVFFF